MIDLSEHFDSPPAYRKRLNFYVEKADAAYRLGAAVKLLEMARRELSSPHRRLSVARDAIAVLQGRPPAPQPLPLGADSSASIQSDLQGYLDSSQLENCAQTVELKSLVDQVAAQTVWADFSEFEVSEEGRKRFELNDHPERQPDYEKWFQLALGYLGTGLPDDQDAAVAELERRINFMLGKVSPADDDRYGLRDRYEVQAYRFGRRLMNEWERVTVSAQ